MSISFIANAAEYASQAAQKNSRADTTPTPSNKQNVLSCSTRVPTSFDIFTDRYGIVHEPTTPGYGNNTQQLSRKSTFALQRLLILAHVQGKKWNTRTNPFDPAAGRVNRALISHWKNLGGMAYPIIVGKLKHDSPAIRSAAIAAMATFGERGTKHIRAALKDKDWGVRRTALLALACSGKLDAATAAAMTRDPSTWVAAAAFKLLPRFGISTLPLVHGAALQRNARAYYATEALGQYGTAGISALISIAKFPGRYFKGGVLVSPYSKTQVRAIEILDHKHSSASAADGRIIRDAIDYASKKGRPAVRSAARRSIVASIDKLP